MTEHKGKLGLKNTIINIHRKIWPKSPNLNYLIVVGHASLHDISIKKYFENKSESDL